MKQGKWLYAKLNLAVALLAHLFYKRWFNRRGLQAFLEDYKEDIEKTWIPPSQN